MPENPEDEAKARRALVLLAIVMAIGIALPFALFYFFGRSAP